MRIGGAFGRKLFVYELDLLAKPVALRMIEARPAT